MKDEWLKAALSDDSMVVDILLRLKNSSSSSSLSQFHKSSVSSLFLPQGWGKRLPRSRSTTVFANAGKKDTAVFSSFTRRSPTTPLSWSGGGGGGGVASPSDGNFDGQSDSSRAFSDLSRSKVESTYISGTSKSSRKKKEFFDLKEEDRGVNLSKMTSQQKRTRSQNAKRIKLDTVIQRQEKELVGTSCDPLIEVAAAVASTSGGDYHTHSVQTRIHVKDKELGLQSSCAIGSEVAAESNQHRRCLILPDLNTMPAEAEDVGTEFVCDYRSVLAFSKWR